MLAMPQRVLSELYCRSSVSDESGVMLVVRIWDVRPYCPSPDRLIKTLMGHQHSFEKVCDLTDLVQVEGVDCRVSRSSSYECVHPCACRTCCAVRGRTTDAMSLAAQAIGTDTCTLINLVYSRYSVLLFFRSVAFASHSDILKYSIVYFVMKLGYLSKPQPLLPVHLWRACRCVYVWDALSRRLLYKLPGHAGSVNETALHPREPIGTPRRTPSLVLLLRLLIITGALQFMPIVFRHKF